MDLDPVILGFPWHVVVAEPSFPVVEGGWPEVHDKVLLPASHPADGSTFLAAVCCLLCGHYLALILPLDVVRGPFELVIVPADCCGITMSYGPSTHLMTLVDQVNVEWTLAAFLVRDGRHKLNIDPAPVFGLCSGAHPVCEE